ncbi:hypothetical protein FI667_g3016, partial [Globisporangium splendens]
MNSRSEDATSAPPLDGEPLHTDARTNESDGGEWPDLLELLPLWGDDDLGDALCLDDVVDGDVEDSAVATSPDSASRSGRQPEGGHGQRQGCTKKLSTRAQRAMEIRRLKKECRDRYETLLALREEVKAAGGTLDHHTSPPLLSRLVSARKRSQSASTPWVAEAEKQRKMLVLVESVNHELKREIRLQKREARSLHRVLTKRIADAQALWGCLFASVDAMPTPLSLSPPVFSDTRMVYARLLRETEAMRPKTGMMLQYLRSKVTFPMANGSFREWKTTYWSPDSIDEEDVAFVEIIDVEELPFPIPNVCDAIENMYRTYEMDNFAKQNFNASDDTIMSTSFFTYGHGENTMHAQLQQVVQHFTTDTYAAFVSTFTVQFLAQTVAEKVPVGKMQEWRIVSTGDDGTTLHQTFAVMMPQIAGARPSPSSSKTLLELLTDGWLTSFSCTNQHIENHLMNPPSSSSTRTLRRKGPWPLNGRHLCYKTTCSVDDARVMSSRPEDATSASPLDAWPLRTDAPTNESDDGSEWPDLLELFPDDELGDALCLVDLVADAEEGSALDGDVSLPSRRPPQPEGARRRKRGRRDTLSTRAQRAIEIRRLQNEYRDLYETLLALREMVKAAGSRHHQPLSMSGLVDAKKHNQPMRTHWVTEATKQRELLLLAEHVNRELKQESRVQKREARSLHRVLTKRVADAKALWNRLFAAVDAMLALSSLSSTIFSDTRMVFAGLLQETEAMHSKVDGVLQYLRSTATFPVTNGSFREWKTTRCSDNEGTTLVELIDVEEFPFPIPNVSHAVESMYRIYEMDDFAKQVLSAVDSNFDASDNTIMGTSFFTYDHGEGIVHARLRQVAQRFTTDTGSLGRQSARIAIVSTSDDDTTLNQTFAVLLPKIAHSTSSPSSSKRDLSQFIKQWLASFSCANQHIENLLMDPPSPPSIRTLCRKRPWLHNWSQFNSAQPETIHDRA